ncbi:tyrosine recombinase XerC [Pseudooceanicola nanhaiensis]|uniref:site-specific integrase n=1 Tax=Pseudooceanicola nanhaiensis TaxID=375761 RepID=UPI001CD1E743|nr:tyrosine-type recombinase/integrase [Pseudooceanicola nanhaiensis]MCA0919688.1 tyrosine-type recombinase/integrase [Pseudooceanicola nanhaiensis]
MKRPDLPYLEFKTVKGRQYIYFRKGKFRHRLPDNPDSEEFSIEYWSARNGKRSAPAKTTWNALIISYYSSPAFKMLSKGSRANYRRHCEAIREKNGDKDMRTFRRKHALAARDALQDTWSKANERVAILSVLCRHAVDLEWIERNPVIGIEKLSGGEYEPWPEAKLRAYENAAADHDIARTAYELGIGTGQRLGDCVKMMWVDFDGEFMAVAQEKTGEKVWVYCPARLREYLRALPKRGAYIMAKNLTQPLGKRQVQAAVETVREKIGVMRGAQRLVPHGWRYTAAVQLAEAGCSDAQIQAVTGHRTLAMVQKYRARADQKRQSKLAQQMRDS